MKISESACPIVRGPETSAALLFGRIQGAGLLLVCVLALAAPCLAESTPTGVLHEEVLPGTDCTALAADGPALWIGTRSEGIIRLSGGGETRWPAGKEGLPAGEVKQLLAADGTLWALFRDGGLARLFQDRWETPSPPPGTVRMTALRSGVLLAATDAGLAELREGRWLVRDSSGPMIAVAVNEDRQVCYVSAAGELIIEEQETLRRRLIQPLKGLSLESFLVLNDRILLGTDSGLHEYRTDGEMAGTLDHGIPPGPPSTVTAMAGFGPSLLLGTDGQGVFLRRSSAWRALDKPRPDEGVVAVAMTAGYAAAATSKGVRIWPLSPGAMLPTGTFAVPHEAAADPSGEPESSRDLIHQGDPAVFHPERLGLTITAPLQFPRYHLRSTAAGAVMSPLIERGSVLFRTSTVFGGRARALGISCEYCHPGGSANNKLFVPGLSSRAGNADVSHRFWNPDAENYRADPVDIPSLRGARATAPYGRDGRIGSLREFIRQVIVLEFDGQEPLPKDLDALTAYVQEMDFLPNKNLDRFGRLVAASAEDALRGQEAFGRIRPGLGMASCATCHPPSAQFTDRMTHGEISGGLYDTPALLGSGNTAPYFHDGRFPALRDVVDHYNRKFELEMDSREVADLTEYLELVGAEDQPYVNPESQSSEPAREGKY